MSDVEWTNDMVIRLVEEYRKRPELWDSSHDLYRVQIAKHEAWADIAGRFECDIADVRKKLNSVLASHRREKSKVRDGARSSWFLYHYMTFLPTHVQNIPDDSIVSSKAASNQKKSTSKIQEPEQNSEDEDEDQGYEVVEEVIVKDEPVIETYINHPKHSPVKTHGKTRLKFAKKRIQKQLNTETNVRQLDSRLVETLRLLRRSGVSRKKDECDSFGEYIADSLRKHDDRTQSMIKQAINNILFEQEMKKYRTEQYTVVLANDDENPLILGNC